MIPSEPGRYSTKSLGSIDMNREKGSYYGH